MLPLGHEATRIMPSAMLGEGCRSIVSANATAGSSTECANRPISVPRGAVRMPLKSCDAHVERDAEQHEGEDHVEGDQRFRAEIQPDRVELVQFLPLGSRCMSLKCIRPGAHMCFTGSTST